MAVIALFQQGFQGWMSFTDFRIQNLRFNLFDPAFWEKFAPTWVGIQNYYKILTSQLALDNYNFIRMLVFNFIWAVSNVFFHVSLGVLIALTLNSKKLVGRKLYRALFILPWAIPGYITALTWRNMYDLGFGAINLLLARVNEIFSTSLPTDTAWLTVPHTSSILSFLPVAY
jgi:arabinogalactan oligomer/maltooligosaccharide transport system permease protein